MYTRARERAEDIAGVIFSLNSPRVPLSTVYQGDLPHEYSIRMIYITRNCKGCLILLSQMLLARVKNSKLQTAAKGECIRSDA